MTSPKTKSNPNGRVIRIVDVLPITKVAATDSLSYFTSEDLPAGALVSVPVRKKIVNAIVLRSREVADLKTTLRSASYEIRKISKVKTKALFSETFIEAASKTAEYYATRTGQVINAFSPKDVLENYPKIKTQNVVEKPIENRKEIFVLQAGNEERYANYKSLIREEFARKVSVFFCLPTAEDVKRAKDSLEKGIEQYTFVFHGGLKKTESASLWGKAVNEAHPVLIIATPPFLSIPRKDFGTIILDKESSRHYKTQSRPFVDTRTFAEFFARLAKTRLVFGDLLLRTETLWRERQGELLPLFPLKFRLLSPAEEILADISRKKSELSEKESKTAFQTLSAEVGNAIRHSEEHSENMLIFSARRGLAPNTVCGDCGTLVLCKTCKAPTVLHTKEGDNFFLCHRCGETRDAAEHCAKCGSWKLTTLGIGIESVESAIKAKFPKARLFRVDKDSTPTQAKALATVQRFEKTPGAILLCTEMALAYLSEPVENVAAVSIDGLFSIPDFRISEKIFSTMLLLRSLAEKRFILQTRNPDQTIWRYTFQGNLLDFYREEITVREELKYPPFSVFIKMSISGIESRVEAEIKRVEKLLEKWKPLSFSAFIPMAKGRYTSHLLIRLPPASWVDKELLDKILSLPPFWSIKVDPESLL